MSLSKKAAILIIRATWQSRSRWSDGRFFIDKMNVLDTFQGGLNWYRNIDRNWELLAAFSGAKVSVPALYIAGERDIVLDFPGVRDRIPNIAKLVPRLRRTIVLPGCGHWTQQERAGEVSAAMIEFLRELGPAAAQAHMP